MTQLRQPAEVVVWRSMSPALVFWRRRKGGQGVPKSTTRSTVTTELVLKTIAASLEEKVTSEVRVAASARTCVCFPRVEWVVRRNSVMLPK